MNVSHRPDWERVRSLFVTCLKLPASGRPSWLADACAGEPELLVQLNALLVAHGATGNLLDGDGEAFVARLIGPHDADSPVSSDRTGERFGVYTIVRLLGEGGMGSVFLAERSDGQFQQQVALKLIRDNFATSQQRERFLRERQILARLRHAHIAQLHDGGLAADGAPYFTLEFVDGAPITRYCDQCGLGIEQRLHLLLDVCDAVQYAHRNLVVHRDLKPSNIFVTGAGQVKLLDFGIAKLLDAGEGAQTETHSRVMTREYAAPEQVLSQPITTATDVYALGVLMYELLCGRLPYPRAERGEISWPKAIVEERPETLERALSRESGDAERSGALERSRALSPNLLARRLRGDLQRIVARALEKAPESRYASVAALAADIQAHLDGRALPGGSRVYRLRKFLRRNRLSLSFAATLSIIAAIGATGMIVQAHKTAREAQSTAAVKDFLLGLFTAGDPKANKGKDPSMRETLDRGAENVDKNLQDQPALQAEVKATLAGIYARRALYPQAEPLFEQAVAGLDLAGDRPMLAASTLRDWGETERYLGHRDKAQELLDQALERMRHLPQISPKELGRTLYSRAYISITKSDFRQGLAYAEEEERVARRTPEFPHLLGDALSAKGAALWGLHDYPGAEQALRAAIVQHVGGWSASGDLQTLALVLMRMRRYKEAAESVEQGLTIAKANMSERHPFVAKLLFASAEAHAELGHYAQARQRYEQVVDIQRETLSAGDVSLSDSLDSLGFLLADSGELVAGEQALIEARDIRAKRFAAGDPERIWVVWVDSELAHVHSLQGKLEQAETELRQALAAYEKSPSDNSATARAWLGDVRRQRGDLVEALALERAALDQLLVAGDSQSSSVATARYYLGLTLLASAQIDEAQAVLRQSLQYYQRIVDYGEHPRAATIRLALGRALAQRDATRPEALLVLADALRLHLKFFGADDPRTKAAVLALAQIGSSPTVAQ
jgi:eukaryotic-like serine/threonine-protein kinase